MAPRTVPPPARREVPVPAGANPAGPGPFAVELAARVGAIARLRWLLAGVAFCYALAIALVDWLTELRLGLPWPLFVLGLPVFMGTYNLAVQGHLRAGRLTRATWAGIAGDLTAATLAVAGTGGAGSWLWTIYPLVTLEAAFLTERRRDTALVALAGLGGFLLGAALAEQHWLVLPAFSRVAGAERMAEGLVGLEATWVAIMDLLAAAAGLMALDVLARINAELRTAYACLDEQYRALGQLERLKSAFLSSVSHEMRTPLAIIQGHAEALADDPAVPSTCQVAARAIEDQAMGLAAKIAQVLEYATLASGGTTLNRTEVRLVDLLDAAVAAARDECLHAGAIMLVGPVAPDALACLAPDAVVEALRQLLRNACAASPPGATVGLKTIVEPGRLSFEVSDAGPGVPPSVRAELGAPFTAADTALTGHTPGLGLGLAYTRLVASLHGGSLTLADREGGGTVVRLELPAG